MRVHRFLIAVAAAIPPVTGHAAAQQSITIPEFRQSTQTFQGAFQIAVEDLDSDGDLDAVFSRRSSSVVLFNDGRGQFQDSGNLFPTTTHGIAIGDVDLDGDPDLFFAPLGSSSVSPVYLNNGEGVFEISTPIFGGGVGVQLLDLENDGDLDAVIEYGRGDTVYVNDGRGNFSKSGLIFPGYSSFSDLNGDGHVDVLSKESGRGYRVFLNDTQGHFSEYSFVSKGDLLSRFVSFADIDNDQDMDVIYSNGEGEIHPSGVLLNDGRGRFTDSGQQLAMVETGRIGTGDLNGDGFVDIVFTDRQRPAQVWLNDGTGMFFDSEIRLMEGGACHSVVIQDLDNDGDLDVFIANYLNPDGNSGLWYNVN